MEGQRGPGGSRVGGLVVVGVELVRLGVEPADEEESGDGGGEEDEDDPQRAHLLSPGAGFLADQRSNQSGAADGRPAGNGFKKGGAFWLWVAPCRRRGFGDWGGRVLQWRIRGGWIGTRFWVGGCQGSLAAIFLCLSLLPRLEHARAHLTQLPFELLKGGCEQKNGRNCARQRNQRTERREEQVEGPEKEGSAVEDETNKMREEEQQTNGGHVKTRLPPSVLHPP